MVQTKVHVWRSIFEFKHSAVQEIIAKYHELHPEHARNCKITFNPITQSFHLETDKDEGEKAFQMFSILVIDKALAEADRPQKPGDKPRNIIRLKHTVLNLRAVQWDPNPIEDDSSEEEDFNDDYDELVAEINHRTNRFGDFNHFKIWKPQHKTSFVECFYRSGVDYTRQVGDLCGCKIETDWVDRQVKIGAYMMEDIENAIAKLNNLEKFFNTKFYPLKAHLINSEFVEKFELRIVALQNQLSTVYKSTLVPPDNILSEQFSKLSSARLKEFIPTSESFTSITFEVKPVWKFADPYCKEPKHWRDYTFPSRDRADRPDKTPKAPKEVTAATGVNGVVHGAGEEDSDDVQGGAALSIPTLAEQVQFNEETGEMVLGSRPGANSLQSSLGFIKSDVNLETVAPKRQPRTKAPVVTRHEPKPEDSMLSDASKSTGAPPTRNQTVQPTLTMTELASQATSRGPSRKNSSDGEYSQTQDDVSDTHPRAGTQLRKPRGTANSITSSESYGGRDSSVTSLDYHPPVLDERAPSRGSVDPSQQRGIPTDKNVFIGYDRPPINTPHLNSMPVKASRKPRAVRAESGTPLFDEADLTEEEDRYKHNTMNQKAPPAIHRQRFQDNIEVIRKHQKAVFKKVFLPAFDEARHHRGYLDFEAKLGRILLQNVSKTLMRMPLHWKEWDEVLNANGVVIHFTDILTSFFQDIEFLEELKLPHRKTGVDFQKLAKEAREKEAVSRSKQDDKGRDAFGSGIPGRVSYEFECCTAAGIKFFVIYDAETFDFEIRVESREFGTVYWGCPTRAWDVKFVLSGGRIDTNFTDKAKDLLDSFQIPADSTKPDIAYETSFIDFKVRKVMCIRETHFQVLPKELHCNHKLKLKVLEHQDLYIIQHRTQTSVFRAQAHSREEMEKDNRVFYTASIISVKAEEALNQAASIELGEIAGWEASDILEDTIDGIDVIEAMVNCVGAIVMKIDDVGANNCQVKGYLPPVDTLELEVAREEKRREKEMATRSAGWGRPDRRSA